MHKAYSGSIAISAPDPQKARVRVYQSRKDR